MAGWANHAKRDLRVSLASVDDATARQVLADHRGIIHGCTRAAYRKLQRSFYVTTLEDLTSVAETAALEAWVTYREGDVSKETAKGGGLAAHVRRTVRWRLLDHVRQAYLEAPTVAARLHTQRWRNSVSSPEHETDAIESQPAVDVVDPVETAQHMQVREWFANVLAEFDPRRRTILVAVLLEGETQVSVANSLGLSKSLICKIYRETLEELRERARADGFDDTLVSP